MSVPRILACLATVAVLCACGTIEERYWQTGVRPKEWAEIRTAIRSITASPVTDCSRSSDDPLQEVLVWTADHKSYKARKVHGKWYFREVIIVVESRNDLTNRWSQPLAVAMRTFDFMKPFSRFATLAAASGGSAPSR